MGKLQSDVIELFTAATVTPVDGGRSGERNLAGLQDTRKLRPIACAEVLVKLGESLDVTEEQKRLNKAYGYNQLGNGEAYGSTFDRLRNEYLG